MSDDNFGISIRINKENTIKFIEFISHLLVSIIFVIALKDKHPYILFLLLSSILGYLIYDDKIVNPVAITLTATMIYGIISILRYFNKNDTIESNTDNKPNISMIWEIPFWTLISFYLVRICSFN